jgi:hypothetical protein
LKTDENMEKVRTVMRTHNHSGVRMSAGKLSVDREMIRHILTTSLNMKEVCAKVILKRFRLNTHQFLTEKQI